MWKRSPDLQPALSTGWLLLVQVRDAPDPLWDRDSVVTPFEGVLRANWATACTSVTLRKLSGAQYTILERFPKLDVAGSTPVSRSIFSIT
jgi:hypothetical protein